MKDDITRMAREAGCSEPAHPMNDWHVSQEALERFAALVAAAERERIIAKNAPEIQRLNAHIKALEEAVQAERKNYEHTLTLQQKSYEREIKMEVEAEREACAKVAKETVCDMHLGTGIKIYGTKAAAAIRARGNT
jgi:hypothetical protein